MPKRKKYSKDFKKKIINEIITDNTVISRISKRAGIPSQTISKWANDFFSSGSLKKEKELLELQKRVNELEEVLADFFLENNLAKKNIILVSAAIVIIVFLLAAFSTDVFTGNDDNYDLITSNYTCQELDISDSEKDKKKTKKKKEKLDYKLDTKKILSITTKEGQKLIGKIVKITNDQIIIYNDITKKKFTIFKKDIKLDGIEVIGNKE